MPTPSFRPLPVTIEEIDRDWLNAALGSRAPDLKVRDFEITRMMRSTCTKIWLKLDLNDAGKKAGVPESVVLKGGFEPHSRHMHYMHEKEVQAYRDVFPVLKLHTPGCYFADYDAERKQGIVIMDDLVARGVIFCDPLKPQPHDMVARRLRALARFHAQTWNTPDFRPGGRWGFVEDMLPNQRRYLDQYLEPEVWQRFVASPRGAASSITFHDRKWMSDALDLMAVFGQNLPRSIIHGDTHLGNLYVEKDGTPGFFDSLTHRAPPMVEVTYHLVCALDTADRKRWEGSLVQHYLDELKACGVEPPGFDDAMHQFGVFLSFAYCIFIINDSVFQAEAVNTAYTARISAAMIDHRTKELLAKVK
jgi:hypothetical protein